MNLEKIRLRNETEELLLSFAKNCQTLIKQTHSKPQETPEFKLTKTRESFPLKLSLNLSPDTKWMVGLTSLEVYNSVFNIREKNKKFELFTDLVDEFFSQK